MHQPYANPRSSIYYSYEVRRFTTPIAPQSGGRHPVVIVGAGPIGLVTALDLARHGVPSVLLTQELQVSEGSRALAYTRRSMEILQQVGVGERIAGNGLPWRFGNSFFGGKRVYRMEIPHDEDDRFAPLTNLQQQYLEAFLVDRIDVEPLIQLCWGNRIRSIDCHADHVTLKVDTPEGEYVLEADWLVACDGAHSVVRKTLGLRMSGASYEGRFVIADIRADLELPTERLCFFDPEWSPGNTVLMHREPHGIWRIDYQLPRDADEQEALRPDVLKASIDAHLATIGKRGVSWELDWSTVYSARAMTLDRYVHNRVIFCGDAAHLLPIFGVRGANTGWQDCHNMAWKLALVIKGVAPSGLVETYSLERVAAAREIIAEASRSARFMSPPSKGFRLLRDATLSLALRHDYVRPLLNWRTSRPQDYAESVLSTRDDDNAMWPGGPDKGAPIRNVRLGAGEYLFDGLGASFYLLLFSNDTSVPAELVQARDRLHAEGVPLSIVVFRTGAGNVEVSGADRTIADPTGRIWRKYGVVGSFGACLVRPDQHVSAKWRSLDGKRFASAVRTALAF